MFSRLHGLFTAYHHNGKIKEQGHYIANKKHREWKHYHENGEVIKVEMFNAGLLVDPSKKKN